MLIKSEREESLHLGLSVGNQVIEPAEVKENLTVTAHGTGSVFFNLQKGPLDLFASTDMKSLQGEVRLFPIQKKISPGVGIGGLTDLRGNTRPFFTLYLGIPFDNSNFYLATRRLLTVVHTELSWRGEESTGFERGVWEGEASVFTIGLNHNPSKDIGLVSEVSFFDIYKGLKDYSWPWEDPRPQLVEMPLRDLRISFGVSVGILR
ncbi:hypothetical protein IIA15_03945 [candidate division TA06 bacterium]|nr:hypothetical protein [candidate division TA06 bacterium]